MWQHGPKRKQKPKKERSLLFWQVLTGTVLTIVVASLVYATWYVTRLPVFTITNVEVVGGVTVPHSEVQKVAEAALEGDYYRLVPRRFSYWYPEAVIKDEVRKIGRVKNVAVERRDRQTVTVVFEEYEPAALWCQDVSTDACLFIDRFGYAFAPAPRLTGSALLRYVVGDEAPALGVSVLDTDLIKETVAFSEALLSELDLHVVVVEKREDDFVYRVALGGEIRTSAVIGIDASLANLKTVLQSEEFEDLEAGMFDYIDLRFGNKVFVHEGTEEVASTTEEIVEEAE